jgi:hypothetical protein
LCLWKNEFWEQFLSSANSEPLLFCEQFCKILQMLGLCLWSMNSENKFWVLQILNLFCFVSNSINSANIGFVLVKYEFWEEILSSEKNLSESG